MLSPHHIREIVRETWLNKNMQDTFISARTFTELDNMLQRPLNDMNSEMLIGSLIPEIRIIRPNWARDPHREEDRSFHRVLVSTSQTRSGLLAFHQTSDPEGLQFDARGS